MNKVATMPSQPGFSKAVFGFRTNTRRFCSPYNLSQQVVQGASATLFCRFSLPPLRWPLAAAWINFFIALQKLGYFWGYDPLYPVAENFTALQEQLRLAKNARAGAEKLKIKHWPTGLGWRINPGSYLAVNGELKLVTQLVDDAHSTHIQIFPELRSPLSANSLIELVSPRGKFLVDQDEFSWSTSSLLLGSMSFSGSEAV